MRQDRQERPENPNRERETPNRNPQNPNRQDQQKTWRETNE